MDQILAATPTITIIDAVKVLLQYHHLQIIVTFLYGHGHALVVVVIPT